MAETWTAPGIEECNAIIAAATLTSEDHGVLISWITLDYGGSGQGFGGIDLYLPKSFTHHDATPNIAGHFIWRVMEVAGVSKWSDLVGKTVRVRREHSKVHAIGHIIKDDWFEPAKDFEQMRVAGRS